MFLTSRGRLYVFSKWNVPGEGENSGELVDPDFRDEGEV